MISIIWISNSSRFAPAKSGYRMISLVTVQNIPIFGSLCSIVAVRTKPPSICGRSRFTIIPSGLMGYSFSTQVAPNFSKWDTKSFAPENINLFFAQHLGDLFPFCDEPLNIRRGNQNHMDYYHQNYNSMLIVQENGNNFDPKR